MRRSAPCILSLFSLCRFLFLCLLAEAVQILIPFLENTQYQLQFGLWICRAIVELGIRLCASLSWVCWARSTAKGSYVCIALTLLWMYPHINFSSSLHRSCRTNMLCENSSTWLFIWRRQIAHDDPVHVKVGRSVSSCRAPPLWSKSDRRVYRFSRLVRLIAGVLVQISRAKLGRQRAWFQTIAVKAFVTLGLQSGGLKRFGCRDTAKARMHKIRLL